MLVLTLLTTLSFNHLAHSWYPEECCSNEDCAPVDDAEIVPGGFRSHGYFIPEALARPSKDASYHLCQYRGRVICFFVPLNG
ncbi:hypothetical protein GGQ91_003278 [Methylobacterium fujisawaense]|uniref:Secreted protein n=1 Tax=Methylobacterium fujisawaense TaxID=107400 RepID=A0ABR6DCS3_9HYPH|nr:hypothetical protein [Methylobacterium fujisawaense]MBA9063877.1 hypothetical protein [Methylobacterium fujisawaense]